MWSRLDRLPARLLPGGLVVFVAVSRPARLLGLALLDGLPPHHALLLPRCRSVHTFGMRFPIDVVFLDRHGAVARFAGKVPPRRAIGGRGAWAALETGADRAERFLEAGAAALVVPLMGASPRRA